MEVMEIGIIVIQVTEKKSEKKRKREKGKPMGLEE
jgi:hypothetical protein